MPVPQDREIAEKAMTPEERSMLLNLYCIVPYEDWKVWPEYTTENIHRAFRMLAQYFVNDAEFTEIPVSYEWQIKGRISQTLYVLYQCGMLD